MCVCSLSLHAGFEHLWKCVRVCNVLRCLCQCRVCVFVHRFRALLFSLFPCSCAPLNLSDALERDITTGAEREASSLSSPSPLYITSYWHQSLFILPPSLSPIFSSISPSLFPVLYFCILLFTFFPSLSLYSSPLVAICCVVRLFQLGSAHCFTDCNTSMVRTLERSSRCGHVQLKDLKSIHMYLSILHVSIHLTRACYRVHKLLLVHLFCVTVSVCFLSGFCMVYFFPECYRRPKLWCQYGVCTN